MWYICIENKQKQVTQSESYYGTIRIKYSINGRIVCLKEAAL